MLILTKYLLLKNLTIDILSVFQMPPKLKETVEELVVEIDQMAIEYA